MPDLRTAEFTKEMRDTHTIYMPQMLHYHNELICAAFKYGGYNLKVIPKQTVFPPSAQSLINKDYCTCAFEIVGNILAFIENNPDAAGSIAILEPQTGGSCRAGNYYNLIIDCLKKTGNSDIPVLSLNAHKAEAHSGFRINARMLFAAVAAVCYGDLLMTLTEQILPYEVVPGQTEALRQQWLKRLCDSISNGHCIFNRKKIYKEIADSFLSVPTDRSRRPTRVGIAGEIYIKFSPIGNFLLEDFLYNHGCEIRQGGFVNYCIYLVYSEIADMRLAHKNPAALLLCEKLKDILCSMQKDMNDTLQSLHLHHDMNFMDLQKVKGDILNDCYSMGDGWLVLSEIIDLAMQGYDKILVVHPFACLVSHVGSRGILKKLNELFPSVKISSIEFDREQSKALRESRILLAIS